MHIIAIGFNYRIAPVELRERFAINEEQLPEVLEQISKLGGVQECVVLATCNRTEIYAVVEQINLFVSEIEGFLAQQFAVATDAFAPFLTLYKEEEAVSHLFHVASGLDSMIIGETQILGQVKDAFLLAQQREKTSSIFNKMFKQAITFAKRAQTETKINDHPVSVSYAAVELAKASVGDISGRNVVLIGAGKMSALAAKHLHASGSRHIRIVNRTIEKGVRLAEQIGGSAYAMEHLADCIEWSDLIISSTGSSDYIVTETMLTRAMGLRKSRPLLLFDLAVPRDIDPAGNAVTGVRLYNVDDLSLLVDKNLDARKEEAARIERMIVAEVHQMTAWLRSRQIHPLLAALQQKAGSVQEAALETMLRKLPELEPHEVSVIQKLTGSIVSQLLREPIAMLKEMAGEGQAEQAIALFSRMYGIEHEADSQHSMEASVVPLAQGSSEQQATAAKRSHLKLVPPQSGSRSERTG
ncbi:glutamyl-tRNA reductase [Paenibacillus phyllosphaerae]|uniref:Glutamyl-tRNA reductase n=1 Tax=Paenibacillus phyllosphaerae TaxID=274593 RepID=A0A7W5AYQ2_9BACL|nr:glutamyl-tRNA reductase [Paenibacillus phyllosphaerae]MBB3111214.1 glutamyl-tRNA reductase [Paenibacillus phyllosphaerae]